jgi:hypothetical protein
MPIWTRFVIFAFVPKIWDIYEIPIPKVKIHLEMLGLLYPLPHL